MDIGNPYNRSDRRGHARDSLSEISIVRHSNSVVVPNLTIGACTKSTRDLSLKREMLRQIEKIKRIGEYSEILKITDSKGNVDYDFTSIQVYDKKNPNNPIPVMQAAYNPTLNIKPIDPVTFMVRSFNCNGEIRHGTLDGSSQVTVKSETIDRKDCTKGKFAETIHSYAKPGHYIFKVERTMNWDLPHFHNFMW